MYRIGSVAIMYAVLLCFLDKKLVLFVSVRSSNSQVIFDSSDLRMWVLDLFISGPLACGNEFWLNHHCDTKLPFLRYCRWKSMKQAYLHLPGDAVSPIGLGPQAIFAQFPPTSSLVTENDQDEHFTLTRQETPNSEDYMQLILAWLTLDRHSSYRENLVKKHK